MLFTVAAPPRSAASLLANDPGQAPAHSCGDGNRNSFIASLRPATTLFRNRSQLAVTIPTSQPVAGGSQIPIAPTRRSEVPRRPAVSSLEAYQTPALGARRTAKRRAGI
jgi:hypothetical protein